MSNEHQISYSQHFIFFINYVWAQYTRELYYTKTEMLARHKHSSLFGPFVSYIGNEVCCKTFLLSTFKTSCNLFRIHNNSFSSKLPYRSNKLERLSLASLSRLVLCNTPAFWTHPYLAIARQLL